ncbi:MAG: glutamyl-tRNA amidotransferase [Flavobacteriaceae bacterium]|mgnify:FL=1|nr:glutamyl-tRNA amidotransferase [Flavobacteriaceae bacterium]|tara:strand:+ start:260 stop:712 length:453 start_codon:yes stop_codon:yes gene_type:complete
MTLVEKINTDIKEAMLTKDKFKLESLRAIKASLTLHQTSISSQNKVTKEDEIKILQKLVKQRKESSNIYTKQNRFDLAKLEKDQADFISTYLPKQLTNQEIEAIVSKVIVESNSIGLKDMGKVIGLVVKEIQGKADGKTISDIVKQKLSD